MGELKDVMIRIAMHPNFMPLVVCNKLGVVPLKSDKHVIQLGRT